MGMHVFRREKELTALACRRGRCCGGCTVCSWRLGRPAPPGSHESSSSRRQALRWILSALQLRPISKWRTVLKVGVHLLQNCMSFVGNWINFHFCCSYTVWPSKGGMNTVMLEIFAVHPIWTNLRGQISAETDDQKTVVNFPQNYWIPIIVLGIIKNQKFTRIFMQ